MELTVVTSELLKTLSLVSRVVSPRPNLPVLSNLLLEAEKAGLSIAATNLETSIRMLVPAKVVKEGKTTVPARVLLDFVASSREEKIDIALNKDNLVISGAETTATLATINALEFPPLPSGKGKKQVVLEATELTSAINQVGFAASVDEGRPVLTGVLLREIDKKLALVATDGYRLVKKLTSVSVGLEDLIIPSRSLLEVAKLIADTESEKINLVSLEGANQVVFSAERFELSSRVLEGSFPNYEQIIPSKFVTEASVKKDALVGAIRQVATLSRDLGNVVQLEAKPTEIKFTAKTAQLGHAEANLAATVKGDPVTIAFNAKYLLDGLGVIDDETIKLKFSGATSPTMILGKAEADLSYIIMPVRIQS